MGVGDSDCLILLPPLIMGVWGLVGGGVSLSARALAPLFLEWELISFVRNLTICHMGLSQGATLVSDHTASKTPDPIRTRKLSGARPG